MAVVPRTGDFKYNYRGSASIQLGIATINPGEMTNNYRGSMIELVQSAFTLTFSTSSPLPDGTNGSAYSQSVVATGGLAPYTYAVTSGSLPHNLSLSSSGAITGTPDTNGLSTFTVTATDSQGVGGNTGSKSFQITIDSSSGSTTSGDAGTGMAGFRLWIGQGIG